MQEQMKKDWPESIAVETKKYMHKSQFLFHLNLYMFQNFNNEKLKETIYKLVSNNL